MYIPRVLLKHNSNQIYDILCSQTCIISTVLMSYCNLLFSCSSPIMHSLQAHMNHRDNKQRNYFTQLIRGYAQRYNKPKELV